MFNHLNCFNKQLADQAASEFDGASLLVTGGYGLIGLSILRYVEHLRSLGSRIQLTLMSKASNEILPASIFGTNYSFISGDLTMRSVLEKIDVFDFVIHGAGYAQPNRFMSDPLETLRINSEVTLDLKAKAKKGFLYVSSSEIYAGNNGLHLDELQVGSIQPSHPRAAYIEGKRFGEVATLSSGEEGSKYENVGAVARLSLAYGPGTRLDDQRVLSQIIYRGLTEKRVALLDPGDRQRTYCFVDDAVELLMLVLLRGQGEVFNVGGKSVVTIRDLGMMIAEELKVPFYAPDVRNNEDASPGSVGLDLGKVLKLAPDKQFVSLEDGLRKTIEWVQFLHSRKSL